MLLAVWNRLPEEAAQVYRLQTDQGECVIGRLISPASAPMLLKGTDAGAPILASAAAIAAVMQDGAVLALAEGLVLKKFVGVCDLLTR